MADGHKNFSYSTVATAPSPATSGTSLVVASGDGTKFPTPPFNATVWAASANPLTSNAEVVRVTAVSTDTLTITRSQESSSVRTIVTGDQIAATITSKTLTDIELNKPEIAASIAALQALPVTGAQTVILNVAGRKGIFAFDSTNNSTNVTADPNQGVYVAPSSDTTGATGAWIRVYDGALYPEWFGTVGTSNDAAVLQACFNLGYTLGVEVLLTKLYTVTTTVNIKAQTIRGTNIATSGIYGNVSSGTNIISALNTTTEGMILDNFLIKGNGTTALNGTSNGLFIGSTLEETSHVHLSNLRFLYHANGLVGSGNYVLFDSILTNVDFYGCSNYGEYLGGSQVTHIGCSYRVCNWGVLHDSPANSIGGGVFTDCTWVQNSYDLVFNSANVRPIRFVGCWFEQSKTQVLGRTLGTTYFMQSLLFESCLFQPSATVGGIGVIDMADMKGIVAYTNCIVYNDLFSGSQIPDASYWTNPASLKFSRLNSAIYNGTTFKKQSDYSDAMTSNQSLSTPGAGFATDTYLVGSAIKLPAGGPATGATYKLVFSVTKTAVGTAAPVVTLRTGTAGSIADTARLTFTFGPGTAVADTGVFEVIANFRAVGAGTVAVLQGVARVNCLPATGISSTIKAVTGVSSGFDSTASGLIIGCSYNGGTSAVHTVTMVRAELIA
jgi:hypothetical protein